jgi:ankyrin repeat protein
MVNNWKERRAQKVKRVDQLFHLLQSSSEVQIDSLLKDHPDLINTQDEQRQTLLVHAASYGKLALLKGLIRAKARLDLMGQGELSALHMALMWHNSGFEEAVEALVDAGIDVNAESQSFGTPLYIAAENGLVKAVKKLVLAGARVGSHAGELDRLPLVVAATHGHTAILKFLLAYGADVNAREEYSHRTALNEAVANGHLEAVQVLLAAGALPDPRDCRGGLATHQAVAKVLLGADPAIEGQEAGGRVLSGCETNKASQPCCVLPSRASRSEEAPAICTDRKKGCCSIM